MKCFKIIYITVMLWLSVCGNAFGEVKPEFKNTTTESTFIKKLFLGSKLSFLKEVKKVNYCVLDNLEFHSLVRKSISKRAIFEESSDSYIQPNLYYSDFVTLSPLYDTRRVDLPVINSISRNNHLHLYQLF